MFACEKYYKKVWVTLYTTSVSLVQYANVMADSISPTPGSETTRYKSAIAPVLLDMADTTWRMFVPTIGLLLVGRHFDVQYGTKPWLMLAGAVLGSLVAAMLIRNQLKMKRGGAST